MPEEVLEDLMIDVANLENQGMPGQMPGFPALDDDVEDFEPPAEFAVRHPRNEEPEDADDSEEEEEEVEVAVGVSLDVSSAAILTTGVTAVARAVAS